MGTRVAATTAEESAVDRRRRVPPREFPATGEKKLIQARVTAPRKRAISRSGTENLSRFSFAEIAALMMSCDGALNLSSHANKVARWMRHVSIPDVTEMQEIFAMKKMSRLSLLC